MKSYPPLKIAVFCLAAISLVLAGSCKKIDYHQLTDEEMKWLHYDNLEVLTFTNDTGGVTKFITEVRLKSYIDRGVDTDEWTTALIQQINDTNAISTDDSWGQLYIIKRKDGLLVTMSWPHFPLKEVPLTGLIPQMATIGGTPYNDIFILNGSNWTDARHYNTKLWISKDKGVVQYQDVFGNTWVRQF